MPNPLTKRLAFWTDIYYSKVRVGAAAFIASSTVVLCIRDLFLAPENKDFSLFKYIPQWRWYTWVIVGLVGLLFLTLESSYRKSQTDRVKVRTRYKEWLKTAERRHTDDLITRGLAQLQSKPIGKAIAAPPTPASDKPNLVKVPQRNCTAPIVYRDGFVVDYFQNQPVNPNKIGIALTVIYENQPVEGRKVGSIGNVSARVTYYDEPDRETHKLTVNRGAWLTSTKETVGFRVNDRHVLILALLFDDAKNPEKAIATTSERDASGDHGHQLTQGLYNVKVDLIAEKEGGEIIQTFNHKLIVEPNRYGVDPVEW